MFQESLSNEVIHSPSLLTELKFLKAAALLTAELMYYIAEEPVDLVQLISDNGVQPLDFWKVQVAFSREDHKLRRYPRQLRWHLFHLGVECLFELVWRSNSEVFTFLEQQRIIARAGLARGYDTNEAEMVSEDFFVDKESSQSGSSRKSTEQQMQSQTPQKANRIDSSISKAAEMPLSFALLFKRLLIIASERIHLTSSRLGFNDATQEKTWTIFKHLLVEETSLLTNNRVDYLILGSIYMVAKTVADVSLTFNEIMLA